ncbi:hypothetical protein ACF09H_38095 [Streptomyces sp. NPDC014983]|uniref:hypothetical protein n=1 Tax=Streptomyces sp. NPDC014983 TaxID=3364933 RepID=UPI0037000281
MAWTCCGGGGSCTRLRRAVAPKAAGHLTWAEETSTGRRRNLTFEETEAFWAFAAIEVLRLTGIRNEVRAGRGEVTADQVVVYRRAGLLALATLLAEHAPPAVVPADPPRGPVRHHGPGAARFVGEEAVAELRVVTVRVEQCVRAIRLLQHGFGHRLVQPAVVGLSGELQHPARNRDGHPVPGQLPHERVDPFPGRCACDR